MLKHIAQARAVFQNGEVVARGRLAYGDGGQRLGRVAGTHKVFRKGGARVLAFREADGLKRPGAKAHRRPARKRGVGESGDEQRPGCCGIHWWLPSSVGRVVTCCVIFGQTIRLETVYDRLNSWYGNP